MGKKLEQSSSGIFSIFGKTDLKKTIAQIDHLFDNLTTTFNTYSGLIEIKSAASYALAYHYLRFITAYYSNHSPAEKSPSELKDFWRKHLEHRKTAAEQTAKLLTAKIENYKKFHSNIQTDITGYQNPYINSHSDENLEHKTSTPKIL